MRTVGVSQGRETAAVRLRSLVQRAGAASGWHRSMVLTLFDAVSICLSLYAAYVLRFESHVPPEYWDQFQRLLPILVAIRVPILLAFGLHRWSFRFSGLHEAARLVGANLAGTGCLVVAVFFLRVPVGPPRSIVAIEFFLTTSLMGAARFWPRLTHAWLLSRMRSLSRGRLRTLIVGAGSAGELLLRDLRRSDEHSYEVIGFVDDDPHKWGRSIGGKPVLGPISRLPELAASRGIRQLLFAIPRLEGPRLREILASCSAISLSYKVLPVSFAYLSDNAIWAMLQGLSAQHLLPRHPVRFDEAEMASLVEGRRILVTGAAGSIGGETCRLLAAHDPALLVLADIDENNLYFLYRELRSKHPRTAIEAQVMDIRDRERARQLGERYRPQDVFHAAAHKHVPLMEDAPEEAVKNNVLGCLNLATMAHATEAEHFVLVSTDKAVNPSSVMGATKRLAELIVLDFARRSRTAFATVRFGNVLGSAGSVVPLFKEQIARGGPVTVTDPECRRFLMSIPEAVGLLVLAGLGRYGDLLILEMGEPIRVLDLARMMIGLAGQVADKEIPIVFTGMRPGEKIDEELMTEEEARNSRLVREHFRVVAAPAPPADLLARVERLTALARAGDRVGVLAALQSLVPGYAPAVSELAVR
jgi:FlaA1/EpsC-like NDP-sugar epimerase